MVRRLLAIYAITFFGSTVAFATPGDLDATFGAAGVLTPAAECCGASTGAAISIQPDGKVVVAGYATDGSTSRIVVVRRNADLTLDTSFGAAGVARIDGPTNAEGRGIAIQPDGRIVVAGVGVSSTAYAVIARLTSSGQPDPSFGAAGVATFTMLAGSSFVDVRDVALQSSGKIVIAGTLNPTGGMDMFAARLNADGSLDTGFATNGVARSAVSDVDKGFAVAVGTDDAIVVVGDVTLGSATYPAAMRLLSSGAPDTSFGPGGVRSPLLGFTGGARDVAIQPDGRILVGGQVNNGGATFRLLATGAVDTSYNGSGVKMLDTNGGFVVAIALAGDGGHVVVLKPGSAYIIHRLLGDGTPDTSWNGGAGVSLDNGFNGTGAAVAIPAPGGAVVAKALDPQFNLYAFSNAGAGIATINLNVGLTFPSFEYPKVGIGPGGTIAVLRPASGACQGGNACGVLERFTSTGAPDPSLDADGRLDLVTPGVALHTDVTGEVFSAPDGKLLFVAHGSDIHFSAFRLRRLNADGSPDGGFQEVVVPGSNTAAGPNLPFYDSVVHYPDGRILVSGGGTVSRVLANGAPDPAFAFGGSLGSQGNVLGIARLPGDGFVFTGRDPGNVDQSIVRRYDASAAIDATFGTAGTRSLVLADGYTRASALALQPDGKTVVAGSNCVNPCYAPKGFVVRLNGDGSNDPTFASGGVATLSVIDPAWGSNSVYPVARVFVQSDGKIIVVGTTLHLARNAAFVVRLLPSGALDPSFGSGGVAYVDVGVGFVAFDAGLLDDGNLVVAGSFKRFENLSGNPAVAKVLLEDASPLSISPDPLPAAGPYGAYSAKLAASGGTGPYTYAITSGTLPPGLTLAGDTISGTPSTTGAFSFALRATDSLAVSSTRRFTIEVLTPASLVRRYYISVLGRGPDGGGFQFWQSEVTRVGNLGASENEAFMAMAVAFFSSAEYTSVPRTDAQYLTDLYRTFFSREPDADGLAYWSGELAGGKPRGAVLNDFLFASEFATYMASVLGDAAGSRPEAAMVMDFYRGLLGRLPDSAGFNYWIGRFRTAQCNGTVTAEADAISSQFIASTEYQNRDASRAANARASGFVADLYNAFLRRGGDSVGFASWTDYVAGGGAARETARQAFVGSAEFQGRVNAVISAGCLP